LAKTCLLLVQLPQPASDFRMLRSHRIRRSFCDSFPVTNDCSTPNQWLWLCKPGCKSRRGQGGYVPPNFALGNMSPKVDVARLSSAKRRQGWGEKTSYFRARCVHISKMV